MVEVLAGALGEQYAVPCKADLDLLAGRERADGEAVNHDVDVLPLGEVQHVQGVVRGDDERAGGERVRGDERDRKALHPPCQDWPAVGEL